METRIYILDLAVGSATLMVGIGLAVALAVGLILACYPDARTTAGAESRRFWGRDAVIASVATLGGYLILDWFWAQLHYRVSHLALAPRISFPSDLGTYLPLISYIRDILLSALFFSVVIALGVHIWTQAARKPWSRVLLLLGLLGSLLSTSARRLSEAAVDLLASLLLVALTVWLIRTYFRNNYLAYILSAAFLSLARATLSLHGQGNPALAIQEWVLWGLALAVAVLLYSRASPRLTIDD